MSTKVQPKSEQAIDALDVAIKEYGLANRELGAAQYLLEQAGARCRELDGRAFTEAEREAAIEGVRHAMNSHWEAERRVNMANYRVLVERRLASQRELSERQAMVGVRR